MAKKLEKIQRMEERGLHFGLKAPTYAANTSTENTISKPAIAQAFAACNYTTKSNSSIVKQYRQ